MLWKTFAIAATLVALVSTFARFPWLLTNISSSTYLPHGFCFLWNPRLLWLHVLSDSVIFVSYTVIALTLTLLIIRLRQMIGFKSIFLLFGTFILACGFTHLIEVIVLWRPLYWLQGDVKLLTACASLITAIVLPFCAPQIKAVLTRAAESAENERRFLAASESSLDGLYILQSVRDSSAQIVDFRILFVNENAARMFSLTREQMIGSLLCELLPQNRTQGFFTDYKRVVETGEPHVREFPVTGFDGITAEWLKIQVVKLEDGVAVTASDISARKRFEIERATAFAESLIENSPAAIIVTDLAFTIIAINPAAQKMLWYQADELVGRATPLIFYSHDEVADRAKRLSAASGAFVELDQAVFSAEPDPVRGRDGEWTFFRKGGSTVAAQVSVTPLSREDGEATGFMITAYDVSERKRREEYISHLAHHDVLTGLPTRQLLMDRLEMMLARSRRFFIRSALLMIDLNNFKNDQRYAWPPCRGPPAGPGRRAAPLVQSASMDTVATHGGRRVRRAGCRPRLDRRPRSGSRKKAAGQPFHAPFIFHECRARSRSPPASAVCVYPDGGDGRCRHAAGTPTLPCITPRLHVKHSYPLCSTGRSQIWSCCNARWRLHLPRRSMREELSPPLPAPVLDSADGAMVGVEALLRWTSKQVRAGSRPAQFIPVAEEAPGSSCPSASLGHPFTACEELTKACKAQLRAEVPHGRQPLGPPARSAPACCEVIEEALAEEGLDPTCLEMEITESLLMSDSPHATGFFDGLREARRPGRHR
jgi:PAS domain S-box-containing protein